MTTKPNPLLRDIPFGLIIGNDFEATLTGTRHKVPVDLSGRTFTAQLRPRPGGELIAEFTVDTTDAGDGQLKLQADAAVTADIPPGTYRWDVRQVDDGKVATIMAGHCVAVAPVTVPGEG